MVRLAFTADLSRGVRSLGKMFTVTESDDKASVTMSDTRWSMAFPAADLPKWLEIYRRFIRNRPSTAQFHEGPVQEIAAAMQRLGMPVPKEKAMNLRGKK